MEESTTPMIRTTNSLDMELDEIDLESLRKVFGSASPEDLNRRKAHELRELWLEKTNSLDDEQQPHQADAASSKARLPRFLLDPKDENHVAPHAVALQLMLGRNRRFQNSTADGLYRRVPRSESETNASQSTLQMNNHQHQQQDRHHSRTNPHETTSKLFGSTLHAVAIVVAMGALACQFVLEVLGGAGAIWGSAEIVRLRKGGPADPSWEFFTWLALGVGVVCLIRFLLVHPFVVATHHPTFAEKHKLHNVVRMHKHSTVGLFLAVIQLAAQDPVLFLHPTKGHALAGCCSCYCVCCGNRWSSFDHEADDDDGQDHDVENTNLTPASPGSLALDASPTIAKASPQRSTWDMSDDDGDYDIEINATTSP